MRTYWNLFGDGGRKHSRPGRDGSHALGHSARHFEALESRALLTVSVTPTYQVTNDWGSGYQAELKLTNADTAAVQAWKLEFDTSANITSIWDAKITSHVGNHYVIVGATWNSSLLGSGSVSFGFVATPGGGSKTPTNYLLNGNPIGGTTTPPPTLPSLSISDVTLNEGQSGTTSAVLTVSLSKAATSPLTVNYATAADSALAGSDFTALSGNLTFAAGQTAKTLTVAVKGDAVVELDEQFYVDLTIASGATLAKPRGKVTIKNDDVATPTSGDFKFTVASDWVSGFTGEISIRNSTATAVTNWYLEFDYAGTISSIWNATIAGHIGNHYVIQNAGYNSTIAAGASTSFGFVASPGGSPTVPANYLLRSGAPPNNGGGGGGTGTTNSAPKAVDDVIATQRDQAVTINVLANDSDPDGDALSVASIGVAAHGTAVLRADSTVLYTPTAGYTGSDTFTYQLRDAKGATAAGRVTVNVSAPAVPSVWPAQVYAPYVDMTLYPTYDLVAAARTQGIRYFSLAFIVADSKKAPAWGGFSEYALGTDYDAAMRTQIAGVRALGGDVVVSFGGAANRELAEVIADVTALKNAYQSVINAYGLTHIDFDIEGAAAADRASIDRRNQAIAALQLDAAAAGKALVVSYTLPVLPTGLTLDGLYILQSAVQRGVNIGLVNVMAMDYGDSAAPNPQGKMGDYAIAAATSLFNQMKTLYGTAKTDAQLWQMVGVTPMIGLNDVTTEVFDQQEARELVAFAQQKHLGRIGMWSLNRDQQNSAGKLGYVDLKSSSVLQSPFEFSLIFNTFTG